MPILCLTVQVTTQFSGSCRNKKKTHSMAISDCQHRAFSYVFGLFCLILSLQRGSATQFIVGGAKGWTVPDNSTSYSYNQWAENTRFRIGDSLLFVYKANQDSVVEVNKQDYDDCSTTAPLSPPLSDGHSIFTFNRSGPHYFISGNKENCLKNEKLVVIVLAERSNRSSNANAPVSAAPPPANATVSAAPSPANAPVSAAPPPANAPVSAAPPPANATVSNSSPPPSGETDVLPSPSPAPTGEISPAAGTVEISPTPQPASSEPHSGASFVVIGFTGFIGAFFASSLLF